MTDLTLLLLYSDISSELWSLKIATIRLCRKQGNVDTCERLLLEELPTVPTNNIMEAVNVLNQAAQLNDNTKIIRSVKLITSNTCSYRYAGVSMLLLVFIIIWHFLTTVSTGSMT